MGIKKYNAYTPSRLSLIHILKEIRDAIEEHRYKEYKAAKLAGMEGSSQAV